MKNKKILGALAALCMGIILCVSSVFAINYWYTIDNSGADAEGNKVTMGNAVTLALTDAKEEESFLWPGGYVTYDEVKVDVEDWNTPNTAGVSNVELPKFALRIKSVEETIPNLKDEFIVYQNYNPAGDNATFAQVGAGLGDGGEDLTLQAGLVIFANLQEIDKTGVVQFNLRLAFDKNADVTFADGELTIVLEIVAYLGDAADDGILEAGEILGADIDADTDEDTKPNDNNGLDPTQALPVAP